MKEVVVREVVVREVVVRGGGSEEVVVRRW